MQLFATFVRNKCKFFNFLVQQKLALLILCFLLLSITPKYYAMQKSVVELRQKKLVYAWHIELWSLDPIHLPNFKALTKTTMELKSRRQFGASAQKLHYFL